MNNKPETIDLEIAFVCDPIENPNYEANELTCDADRPEYSSFELIHDGLSEAFSQVRCFKTLEEFIDELHTIKNSVVFPYWFGSVSRNRHALVPAICEAYGLSYVGADAYTKIICNDKHLSKSICTEAGLRTPRGFVITGEDELSLLENCLYPMVIKPNFQGSSLGINDDSLVHDYSSALHVAAIVSEYFGWPVICEEFIPGREVSICLIGDHISEPEMRAMSWAVNGDETFLDSRLFTFDLKYNTPIGFTPINCNDMLTNDLRDRCTKLFNILNKVEIMRIDGRVNGDEFTAIELTPDIDLRPDGELATCFNDKYSSYANLLRKIVWNTLKRF